MKQPKPNWVRVVWDLNLKHPFTFTAPAFVSLSIVDRLTALGGAQMLKLLQQECHDVGDDDRYSPEKKIVRQEAMRDLAVRIQRSAMFARIKSAMEALEQQK